MSITLFTLATLILVASILYSSVGHGGASGYLAILSLYALSLETMATTALILNLIVSGIAFCAFRKEGYFSWKLAWPFCFVSVPAAFLGGTLKVAPVVYSVLLLVVLTYSAARLLFQKRLLDEGPLQQPNLKLCFFVGAGLGLLSGIVGVGGGIFLSPLLILMRWAHSKQVAAVSAFFIWINSASGLLARWSQGNLEVDARIVLLLCVAFFGSMFGAQLGARFFSSVLVRKMLAFVLLIATLKLFIRMVA